jgi:D-threo-aldose 1-dehydrogenase
MFNTRPAPQRILNQVAKIQAVCQRHNVPMAAAALQFPLAHPVVASTIPGAQSIAEFQQNLDFMQSPIPAALWADLKSEGLMAANAPVPEGR